MICQENLICHFNCKIVATVAVDLDNTVIYDRLTKYKSVVNKCFIIGQELGMVTERSDFWGLGGLFLL